MAGWISRQVRRRCKHLGRSKTPTIFLEESYLRDDIPCGSAACLSCQQDLPPLPADVSHYVVPDADAILDFLEVLELPQFTAVIYLASVVKQVLPQCSQRTYRRLRSLFADRRRRSLFFDDDHLIYTCAAIVSERKGTEGVAAWYSEHIERRIPVVVWKGKESNTFSFDDDDEEDEDGDLDLLEQFKQVLSLDSDSEKDDLIQVLCTRDYFQRFWGHDTTVTELYNSLLQSRADVVTTQDLSGSVQSTSQPVGRGYIYSEHLAAPLLEKGIREGILRVGVFHVSKHDPSEGFVRPSNKGEASQLEIFVPGSSLQNRALPGDLVAVRLLPRVSWRAPKKGFRSKASASEASELVSVADELDDRSLQLMEGEAKASESEHEEVVATGEIVGILQRVQKDYVACLTEEAEEEISQSNSGRHKQLICIPRDRRIPVVRLATRQGSRLVGQRFVIRIKGWEQDSRSPNGHVINVLGPIGDLTTETAAILVENEINTAPFSSLSLTELPEDTESKPWAIPEAEFLVRRDIRSSHKTFSIDPPGSKDVDDALSVRRLPNGLLEVGVHIADVSYFVRQASLLDLEARARGTTVYMVGRSWQMLPSSLSENLCSLRGGQDRLAVSVIWTVDLEEDFLIKDAWFGRTIIRSQHQMFYAQAQAILDGQRLPAGWEISGGLEEIAEVRADLVLLAKFAEIRRALRKADGALELSSTELKFDVNEGKEPVNVEAKQEIPMNSIVAELMILANSFVAHRIYESFPTSSLLRKHDPPRLDNFALLLQCCAAKGFLLDTSSNKALSASLEMMRYSNDPAVERAFKALVTRAMSEAKYCSTGEISESTGFYHYGLALQFYTHFTSPIRRYADVLVHRMLLVACQSADNATQDLNGTLKKAAPSSTEFDLKETADHLNRCHRASKVAQKECNELYLLMYLQKHAKAELAVVLSVQSRGLLVFVPKYDLRGPVYLQNKSGDVILPAEDDEDVRVIVPMVLQRHEGIMRIVDSRSGKPLHEFKLMDSVWVQLKADGSRVHSPTLRIRLLSENHAAAIAAKAETQRDSLFHPRNQVPGKLELHHRLQGDFVATKFDKRRAIKAMEGVEGVTKEAQGSSEKKKTSKKRKSSTVSEVIGDIKRLKSTASSLFLDFTGAGELLSCHILGSSNPPEQIARRSASTRQRRNVGLPQLVTFTQLEPIFSEESASIISLRRVWQEQLGQAARIRARQLRLRSSCLGYGLDTREADSRKKARLVYMYFRREKCCTDSCL